MTETTQRHRLWIAGTAVLTGLLMTLATPAWADSAEEADLSSCWVEAETGTTHCFADEKERDADIVATYGSLPIEEGSPAARQMLRGGSMTAAASYTIARLYIDANYGGSALAVVAGSSTFCASGSVGDPSLSATYDNKVSSVRSYWGCTTTLYANTSYGGASATYSSAGSLGAMNDVTSSYRVQ